jgi:creatinine amidohydrolase
MRFEDMNWFDIESYLEVDDRLLLVIGACEQHGYLSLLTDVKIPMALADAASKRSGVLVAPPLNFGCSPYFVNYPGTMSLKLSTMLSIVDDLIRSVYLQGFRKILVINGHGGNDGVRSILYELLNELENLKIQWYSWWESDSVQTVAKQYDLKPGHANWLEAFSFTRVGELPADRKYTPRIPGLLSALQTREIFDDGVFGGDYSVKAEIMEELFQSALNDILSMLEFRY